jgi:hypothetical protein
LVIQNFIVHGTPNLWLRIISLALSSGPPLPLTELGGCIEDISAGYAYFGLDSIHLCENLADDDGTPLEKKMWPKNATKLLRLGVPLDDIKPFDGGPVDKDDPCWEVRV